jgi:hypothetical protein
MLNTSNDENVGGAGVDSAPPPASQRGLNPGNEVSTTNADAGEIAQLNEDLANVRRMLADLADDSSNRAPSRVPPPAASGPSVGQPPARGSEYRGCGSEMENDTPAQATTALEQDYARAAAFENILWRAGFVDEHFHAPQVPRDGTSGLGAARRLATCRLTRRPAEDGDDDELENDSGVGKIAELPPGFPAWPLKPFLARTKFFTKGWQK